MRAQPGSTVLIKIAAPRRADSSSASFAGIALLDVPAFIAAQLLGALLAAGLGGWLFMLRDPEPVAETVLDPTIRPHDHLASDRKT